MAILLASGIDLRAGPNIARMQNWCITFCMQCLETLTGCLQSCFFLSLLSCWCIGSRVRSVLVCVMLEVVIVVMRFYAVRMSVSSSCIICCLSMLWTTTASPRHSQLRVSIWATWTSRSELFTVWSWLLSLNFGVVTCCIIEYAIVSQITN